MIAFDLRADTGAHRCLSSLAALRGAALLGRGAFSAVYESATGSVLKLTVDRVAARYLVGRRAPVGVFKPRVLKNFGAVGETDHGDTLYLFELERLQPLRRGSELGGLARRIINHARQHNELPEEPTPRVDAGKAMHAFMTQLNDFREHFECGLDVHWGNFMERTDGTLVFSDPFADCDTFYKMMDRY